MKILAFDRQPGSPCDPSAGVDLFPDSSIVKDGKPFFVPSLSSRWTYLAGLAFHVGRLGKSVTHRFAPRYLDAVAMCVITRPDDALTACAGRQHGLLNSYEGAIILGDPMPLPPGEAALTAEINGMAIDFTGEVEAAFDLFTLSSSVSVMKIGDIIVSCRAPFSTDLPLDSRVVASLNGNPALNFRIK